ncbi:hypothetical protein SLE2022_377430 [Rubroshorea leprosula]
MREKKQNRKGLWTEEEDRILSEYVRVHGRGHWNRIPKLTGLKRCGKSCRMRWLNYLSPNVKHGDFSEEEEDLVVRLHKLLGNRWSLIAGRMPGRTDNQVKNFWNTRLRKKLGIEKTKVEATRSRSSKMHSSGLAEETQRILSPENFDFERLQSSEVTVDGNPPNAVEMRTEELQFGSVEFGNSDGFDMDGPEFLEFYDGYPFDEIWQN